VGLEEKYVPLVRLCAVRERVLPYGKETIDQPEKVAKLARCILESADREYLLVIPVDSAIKPVGVEVAAIGALNYVHMEPREIFKYAIISNAYGIILVHNHPSGSIAASREDFLYTARLKEVGKLVGIPILDHVIVGEEGNYQSLTESVEWKEWEDGGQL